MSEREWNGEGLPPVGAVCECWHRNSCQGMVTILYMGTHMCVLMPESGGEIGGPLNRYSFRPFPAAQRAEDEAVEAMVARMECAVESDGLTVANSRQLEQGARALRRAGYRKVES